MYQNAGCSKGRADEQNTGLERGGWFSIRVINPWNELPPEVVNAPTIRAFKRELDEYMKRNSHNM